MITQETKLTFASVRAGELSSVKFKPFITYDLVTGKRAYGSPEIERHCTVHQYYMGPATAIASFLFRIHRRIARLLGAKW